MPQENLDNESPRGNPQGFGLKLRQAREAQGISLGDMAVKSRLAVNQLRALEAEDMSVLPEPVYVRAFIRGVAQELGLDAEPLVADYVSRFGAGSRAPVGQIPESSPDEELVIGGSPRHHGLKLAAAFVLVAVVAAGIWAIYTDQLSALRGGKDAAQVETTAMGAPEPAAALAEKPAAKPSEIPEAAKPAEALEKPVDPTPAQTEAAPEKPVEAQAQKPAPAAASETPSPASAAADSHRVAVSVKAPCWVQIRSPNGKLIVAREIRPNEGFEADVPRGSRFTLGNAGAITLRIDGQVYSLEGTVKNGVARFTME